MESNNKSSNMRLLGRAMIFVFLTNLFSVVLYHGLVCPGEYDSKLTTVGNTLDFNIRPLLMALSFVDVLIVLFLVLSIWSLAQGDFKMNSYCWGIVWYVFVLLLSKFLLWYILKDDEIDEDWN